MARRAQMSFFDYDGFVEKFKPKKTTDDCYTPENVYNAVRDWAVNEYGLEGREIVRPFWPGADYQAFDYPPGCVVIDNPPFSIISEIVKWYAANGVDYFLFSPYLTNLGIGAGGADVNHVIAPVSVTYENGARIYTCFVTNLSDDFIRAAPDLMDAIQAAEDANTKANKRTLPKYEYPDCVITSAAVGWLCKHHTRWRVKRGDCLFIRKLDAQGDKSIFGGGYLLTERAAAERAAAVDRKRGDLTAAVVWELSPREREMQRLLSQRAGG